MPFNIRLLSLMLRRRHSRQEGVRTLRAFAEWREAQRQLPAPGPLAGTVLVIRLDDIGDYLLFRNQLSMYKRSARWGAQSITLLGNASWKELFTAFDGDSVDDAIWVNKGEYLTSAPYRAQLWAELRGRRFATVIAPSRTRPLLLDDLCRLAAAPTHSIGCANTYVHAAWNAVSDSLYAELFAPPDTTSHEFHFNGEFAAWCCGIRFSGGRPQIGNRGEPPAAGSDVICFIGANTRSRRWPAKRWIEFIRRYTSRHGGTALLAGGSAAEREIAARIQARTAAQSIVGSASLLELIRRMQGAGAVLSNDTMAVHLAVSCGRPTVIIANGVNYQRFTDYASAGIAGVATVYPRVFLRRRARAPGLLYHYADALTSDIASIGAADVLQALERLLNPAGEAQRD